MFFFLPPMMPPPFSRPPEPPQRARPPRAQPDQEAQADTYAMERPSLYAQYVKEREGFDTVETPEGFLTFRTHGKDCYIRDLFILPEHRKLGAASMLADRAAEIALERGCTCLIGTIDTRAKGFEVSLKVLLAYGFDLSEAHEGYLVLRKKIVVIPTESR